MLRLNLLGAVDLVDAGRSRNGDLGGTKPLALLVYLVITGRDKPIRRDIVATLLWPESEQGKARRSLNQALFQLRAVLGEDVIRSQGQDELAVDPTQIECDCFEFADLAQNGRFEDAVGLYRGEFAKGLYAKESAEYEDWISQERTHWRETFTHVLEKLYHTALAAGDLNRAATWVAKLIDVAPDRDEPVRALLERLRDAGNAPAAIRLYEQYKRKLYEAYEIAPAHDITSLIDNLPKAKPFASIRRHAPIHIADAVLRPRRNRRIAAVGAAAIVATFFALKWLGVVQSQAGAVTVETSAPKVAVIELESIGPDQSAAKVLSDALQWRLRDVGFDVLNTANADTAAVRKLADVTGQSEMTFVVGGEVETQPDASLVARLWLKEAGSGKRLWGSRFTQKEQNAHLIATQLSEAVANEIRKAAGIAAEMASVDSKVPAESWRDVYRARELIEAAAEMRLAGSAAGAASELTDAETTLIDVTEREPDWALPWLLRARVAADRALNALMAGDPGRGAIELDRGIRLLDAASGELDSPDVYEMRGLLEYHRWLYGIDDVAAAERLLARAETDLRKALAMNPQRSGSYATLSGVMFGQGKYSESFVYARRAYRSNLFLRRDVEILNRLFNSALHAGDDASADQWCSELGKAHPGAWPAVLCRIHLAGFAPEVVNVRALESEIKSVDAAPTRRRAMEPRLKAAYAISLAQVGMSDSARAVLAGIEDNQSDPEVMLFRAFALAALKDAPQAHAALRTYLSEYRGTRSTALHMRWLN